MSEIKQYSRIYHSTLEFDKFIKKKMNKSKLVLDAGCGIGGTLSYYVRKYKNLKFIGMDYRKKNLVICKKFYKKLNLMNQVKFKKVNILKKINDKDLSNPDGIISQKTFCTFNDSERALKNLLKLNPKWIAINSLFFDGNLDVFIHTRNRFKKKKLYSKINNEDPDGDLNIFALDVIKSFLRKYKKYKITKIKPFFPNKSISRIKGNRVRGTYTLKTEINKFTMFSGPIYLPWHFVMIEKI